MVLAERLTHWVKYVSIYLLFVATMLPSGWDKVSESTPEWFEDQFGGTWVADFPGLDVSWKVAGVLELVVVALMLVSIVLLEPVEGRRKPFLKLGLMLSAFVFAYLAAGQRIVDEFDGAASLFFYFGATMVTYIAVRRDEIEEQRAVDAARHDHPTDHAH